MALFTRKPDRVILTQIRAANTPASSSASVVGEMGVQPSMGSIDDAYDNAMAESFFASLECELIDRLTWKTKADARLAVFTWIESWYKPIRRHSGLGYLSPANFERRIKENKKSKLQLNERTKQKLLCEKV